jgi:hypothetical protein
MKRIALLIGSPSTKENGDFLSGVKTDIENIYNFLLSSIGGSWDESEIIKFKPNPSYSEVKPYLDNCQNVDYAFVYFSGHGYTGKDDKARVMFNHQEAPYVIKQLANRAKHQITIIDACRSMPEYIGFDGVVLSESINFPNPNPAFSKALFSEYIAKLPNTRTLLFATSKGRNSIDLGNNYGGLFSTTLLSVVKEKLRLENKPIYKVIEVFKVAKINTQKIQSDQIPQIYYSNENSEHLPFAINPNYTPPLINEKKQVLKESNTTLIKNITKGTLIGGSILLAGYVIGSLLKEK